MSSPEPTHGWSKTLHNRHLDRGRTLQLIASLANLLDKPMIVETMKSVLGVEPVEKEDCVLFDDLSIKFGKDGRVIGLCHTLDGTSEPAKTIIQNLSGNGLAT